MKKLKPSKYKNVKTVIDGVTFASKKEAERYRVLKTMEQSGKITGLELQKRYQIAPGCTILGRKRPPRYYVADFCYFDADGNYIVNDVKGKITDVYSLKRHLMKTVHGIDIFES